MEENSVEDDPTAPREDVDRDAEDAPTAVVLVPTLAMSASWPRLPDALIVSTDATDAAVEGPPLDDSFFFLLTSYENRIGIIYTYG